MMQPKSRRFLDLAIDKLGDKCGDPMRTSGMRFWPKIS
jgi:hypothetical protein